MSNNPADWSTTASDNSTLPLLSKRVNGEKVYMSRDESNAQYAEWAQNHADAESAKLDPVNFPLTKVQFHAILHSEGLFDTIETAIKALPTSTAEEKLARGKALSDFLHANPIHRDNPLFDSMKGAVGLTDAQIDALWMVAKDL